MKPTPGVWGIDIGQCALKALRLEPSEGGVTATAFDFIEYPKILSQPDADPDQLVREALTTFLSRNSVRGDTVAIAVPGQSGLARFVKLPPVEEKKIAEIVKFEAKQQIPFNLDEVVWDYQKIGSGEVIDGLALETEIGLFAMKRDMVAKYMQHFKDVKVEVHIIQMAPLSLCNFLAFDLLGKDPGQADDGKRRCVVGLDVGADSSNMVVTDGARVIWQRPIPLGGNHFTRALTKDLKLTFAKAEHMKRNAAKSGAAELKKVLVSLKPVLTDFVGEVQRSLNFFTNTHRDAQIEYMVGLGNAFRLPGMQKFLAEKLQMDVRRLDKLSRATGDTVTGSPIFAENLPSFAVCYGLALQGMARARLLTNLLPPEVRMERMIRAKKPWAVAAAGLLLLGLGASAMGNYLKERPYITPEVLNAMDEARKTTSKVKEMQTKFEVTKKAAELEEEAVKAIVAGQFERENWLHLARFVSDCVPQPDGRNLTDAARKFYYDEKRRVGTLSGKEAHEAYKLSKKELGTPPAKGAVAITDPLPVGIDDLIQYHIESVDCRFCDDLTDFWKQATKEKNLADVEPAEQFKKQPTGKGWVVEISGFTFHRDEAAFIRNTILKTLAMKGTATVQGAGKGGSPPKDDKDDKGGKGGKDGQPGKGGKDAPKGSGPGPADFLATKAPVVNKVSHVLLYKYLPKKTSAAQGFEIIDYSELDTLVQPSVSPTGDAPPVPGGKPAPGTGGKSGPSAAPKIPRSNWAPVSPPKDTDKPGPKPGMGPGSKMPPAPPSGGNHTRTEFIILFVWQEPIPSDTLRCPEGQGSMPSATGKGGRPGGGFPGRPGPR